MGIALRALSAGLMAALMIGASAASAEELASPVTVEVYVDSATGEIEIVCPTTACNAICRDVAGEEVLLAGNFYRIGSNCSITISDGALLQEAIETVLALLGDEVPGGPGQAPPSTPTGFTNAEANPNQNNPGLASPTQAGPVTP